MSVTSTWQELLDRFTTNCPKEVLLKIHKCKDPSERVGLCLLDESVKQTISEWVKWRVTNNKFVKSAELSTGLRRDGNKLFSGPNPDDAWDIYTKSVLTAPDTTAELRLAYGNLSAVYFHLEKYDECVSCVNKSLIFDNEARIVKLLLRKVKALIHLARVKEAARTIAKVETVLKSIREKDKKADLSKFKAELEDCRRGMDAACKTMESLPKPPEEVKYTEPRILSNPVFPYASDSVELRTSAERGRHVVAAKALKFGSVLFAERPVAFVVLPQFRLYYCNHCCHTVTTPIPCRSCSGLVYCSEVCRDKAHSYHKYECSGGLSIAYSTGIAHLALRLALIKPLDPTGYSRSSSLLHHFDLMPPEDVYSYSLTGFALSLYLEEVGFGKCCDLVVQIALDIGRLVINGHSIDDIRTSDSSSGTRVAMETEDKVATAIYPSASMMNHSCRSNIANCFYGQYLLVKANQDIEQGGQIFNCYGVDCMRNGRKERQEVLKSQYKFECDCAACTSAVDPNDRFTAMACSLCRGPVVSTKCLDCSRTQTTSKETIGKLREADEKYSLGMDFFQRDWSKSLEILEEVLETRSNHLYRLNKDIGLVYDRIIKCHIALRNYDIAYGLLKEKSIPRISEWYGENSIELANVMNNCINLICTSMMNKYAVNSPDCDVQDSVKVVECIRMMDQVDRLFDLYYGQWSLRYQRLIKYKNFLVPLSQVWQYFLQARRPPP